MKLKGVPRLVVNFFPKEIWDWWAIFVKIYNETVGTLYQALKNNLTFEDNFNCRVFEFEFTNNVELSPIKHGLSKYNGVIIIKTPDDSSTSTAINSFKTRTVDNQNIAITVTFAGGGTTSGKVKFIVLGA